MERSSKPVFHIIRTAMDIIRPIGKTRITGYQKELDIILNNKTPRDNLIGIKFKGEIQIERGNKIKTGIILDKSVVLGGEYALYIELFDNYGCPSRRDFMEGYTPTKQDKEKLGLL